MHPAPPRRTGRIALAVLSVLALVITGFAWQSIDSLRNNLATAGGLGLGGGDDGAVDILMVGTDSRTDAHGNPLSEQELATLRAGEEIASNTDTIVLIRVPNDGSSATAISIPRDSYVKVPGLGMSKINAAYGATKETTRLEAVEDGATPEEAEKKSTEAGREALVESVADLTGITVDHYAEVGLLGFVLLTNAVGGVDVCLNDDVCEPLSGADFEAGEQTLEGADALSLVRQRHALPRGDLDRIVRQQVFMASLVNQALSAETLSNPSKLDELSSAVERSVVLDEGWDIVDFAQKLKDLAGGEVKFQTIPVADINGMTDYGESIVRVEPDEVKKYISGLVGEEPESVETTTTTTEAPDIEPSTVTVNVSNSGSIGGLAGDVAAVLTTAGYNQGEVANYEGEAVSESTVFAHSKDDDGAAAVAAELGDITVETDSSLPEGTVHVVLSDDYSGPTSASEAGSASSETSSGTGNVSTSPTPAPPGRPIDAGTEGPRCVN
ncbi:MAG: LCP family protein [Rhodococcus sp.]|nr:LCP family protein [Rhodococcus sp. (in: high G+C Gram-positive bacteria)]